MAWVGALLWLLLAVSAPARGQPVETVELHHRGADELLPLLVPLAGPDVSISGTGNRVFLRAGRLQADRLRALIAQLDQPARRLLVTVREDPPADRPQAGVDADGSVTVSTGREREARGRESRADGGRSTTVATADRSRRLQIREGDRVRIDLPATESIRFRVPAGARAPSSPGAAAPTVGGTAPGAGGVVYFESVAAFAARFALAGRMVAIELAPLRPGTVAAHGEAPVAVTVRGPIGEWIALGDADPGSERQGAEAGPVPNPYPGVWVRVELDPAPASPR